MSENNGSKPYEQIEDLVGKPTPIFGNTQFKMLYQHFRKFRFSRISLAFVQALIYAPINLKHQPDDLNSCGQNCPPE